ncbi:MAG: hypothetical protein JSR18_04130 [Proteobacteria bacterium]|nr:hypothetical protein [Pseudomonadota bacterium]
MSNAVVLHQDSRPVTGVIERVLTRIPAPRVGRGSAPVAPRALVRTAARQAAMTSGALALPPGPLGLLTILPDLHLIWKIQRQMVADLFALEGRSVELTRTHMLYCLFRHAASHVARDVLVRSGQRVVVKQLSSSAMKAAASAVGVELSGRVIGQAAGRWVPLVGAAAVASYAYWDTHQVARTALRLLDVAPARAGAEAARE